MSEPRAIATGFRLKQQEKRELLERSIIVREKRNAMNDAWFEGAKSLDYYGISGTALLAEIEASAASYETLADLDSELKMENDSCDDKHVALDDKRSKVGVAGNPDYGNDSPLYSAMVFVRKSEKKSNLPRKTKP